MPKSGFTKTQLSELSDMFFNLTETMSQMFAEQKQSIIETLRSDFGGQLTQIREDIKNLASASTPIQITNNHETRIQKLEKRVFRSPSP